MPTAAQGNYADVPSHASGGSIGYHQPGSLEQNMMALGGHRALPIIMALHKANGGRIDLPKFAGGGDLSVSEQLAQDAGVPQDTSDKEPSPYPYVAYQKSTLSNDPYNPDPPYFPGPDKPGVQSLDPISVHMQKPSFLQNLGENILGAADLGKTLVGGTLGMVPAALETGARMFTSPNTAQDIYEQALSHYTPDLMTQRGKEMGEDLAGFMQDYKIPMALPELMAFEGTLGPGAGAALRKSNQALKALEPEAGTLGSNLGNVLKNKEKLHYEPAPPLTKNDIESHAERMVRQMEGTENPNNITDQQLERNKNLEFDIRQTSPKKDLPIINYEDLKNTFAVGIPGDPSRGGVLPGFEQPRIDLETFGNRPIAGEYLHGIGGEELAWPVPLYGGKDYGAYGHQSGWASNLSPSEGLINVAKRLYKEDPTRNIIGQYHKMIPDSLNFARHTLESALAYHKPQDLPAEQISELNNLMRNVQTKNTKEYRPYPEFSGFEDPSAIIAESETNPDMRKKILHLLGTNKYFPGGKQKMDDIYFATSHPELRNIETGAGGSAILKMDPTQSAAQNLSPHPTYSHEVPSQLIGQSRYITPLQLLAPRSYNNAMNEIAQQIASGKTKNAGVVNQMKSNVIREPIDEQFVNQMGEYENAMRKRLGYAEGGEVQDLTEANV